ncbi:MAG: peptide-methionine (S)-S-oxide reductase MsrA [Rubripirellula sp.]
MSWPKPTVSSAPLAIAIVLAIGLLAASASADEAAKNEPAIQTATEATATFAGGCFWCMEPPFDKMPGVISTTAGYTGGRTPNPTYEAVKTGRTGHIESMQVKYDPSKVTYQQLLTLFWHNVDPITANGQFCDKGGQYRTAIFYENDEQKEIAQQSKQSIAKQLNIRVRTELIKATKFYPAEEYHQDYYTKNPTKYKFYRWTCGRDARLDEIWGDKARKP